MSSNNSKPRVSLFILLFIGIERCIIVPRFRSHWTVNRVPFIIPRCCNISIVTRWRIFWWKHWWISFFFFFDESRSENRVNNAKRWVDILEIQIWQGGTLKGLIKLKMLILFLLFFPFLKKNSIINFSLFKKPYVTNFDLRKFFKL